MSRRLQVNTLFCNARVIYVKFLNPKPLPLQEALQADADASKPGLRIISVFLPQPNLLLPVQQTWFQKLIEPTASLQFAVTGALTGIGYYFKDYIVAFLQAVFRRKFTEATRRESCVTVSSRDENFPTVRRYLDEVCVKNRGQYDLRVYTPGKASANKYERPWLNPLKLPVEVKQPEAVRFALETGVEYRFQYAPYVMKNSSKIKLWKKSLLHKLQQFPELLSFFQSCTNIASSASLPNSPAQPSQTSMYAPLLPKAKPILCFQYDARFRYDDFAETLKISDRLDDVRALLEDIQAACSDHDDDANFPDSKKVAELLGSVNRALGAQQGHVTLLSRIWSEFLSLFFKDNYNECRYQVDTRYISSKENGPSELETLRICASGLDNALLRAVVRRSMLHSHKFYFRTAVLALMTGDIETLTDVPLALGHALAAGKRRNEVGLRPAARRQTACFRDGKQGIWMLSLEESTGQEPRKQDSVVYEGEIMKELLDDVKNFFRPETVQEYIDKNIPHRLGSCMCA